MKMHNKNVRAIVLASEIESKMKMKTKHERLKKACTNSLMNIINYSNAML